MTQRPPAESDRRLALLFSGGLDTTLEVVDRVAEYDEVHLLTFNNGYCINMGGARRRAEELQRVLGQGKIFYAEVNTKPLLEQLLAEARRQGSEFRSPLAFDLACKMASVTELAAFALERGIRQVSDGAAAEQTEIFLQDMAFLAHVKPYLESFGLTFRQPRNYHQSREEKLDRLEQVGLRPGVRGLEKIFITSQLGHQPFCLRGAVTFFFTSPLRHLPPIQRISMSVDQAKELWDRLLPVAEGVLQARLDQLQNGG